MVYDTFMFMNELDVLRVRLETMKNVVDEFIIIEAPFTHKLNKKPYVFEECRDMFKDFLDKIHYIKIPEEFYWAISKHDINRDREDVNRKPWYYEWLQRQYCIKYLLETLTDDDTLIFGDIDEILKPRAVKGFLESGDELSVVTLPIFVFKWNLKVQTSPKRYTYLAKWSAVKDMAKVSGLASLRHILKNPNTLVSKQKQDIKYTVISNGGWHFSIIGDRDAVRYKFKNVIHDDRHDEKSVMKAMDNLVRPGTNQATVAIDLKKLPKYIQEQKMYYAKKGLLA